VNPLSSRLGSEWQFLDNWLCIADNAPRRPFPNLVRCWALRFNARPDQRPVYSLLVAHFLFFRDKILF
jgi:hypothetical protein